MVGKKEEKFLTFYLDDGDTIRYDLSTGEQIGVKGKPVKSVAHKTKGYSIQNFIESIEDKNYQNFFEFCLWKGSDLYKKLFYGSYIRKKV